jgi:hypothetical protein
LQLFRFGADGDKIPAAVLGTCWRLSQVVFGLIQKPEQKAAQAENKLGELSCFQLHYEH